MRNSKMTEACLDRHTKQYNEIHYNNTCHNKCNQTGMISPKLSVTVISEHTIFKIPTKVVFTIFGIVVTLTFDLLTLKCNQFIFVPKCI